ncbi:DUF4265 domain-containing protein [Flavobacterium selenitireducens]|uniref:DUF4265 domain-containing protein n=1 Tax=Flavobacterium selenitireducens TaxID=2722704 RepID=UPI00168B7557|nr:DUF4265 domain-containing protein [Flavobacterium selenitireducens]MBD3581548.1 DUF4265 domain-containing protein [Flavobacterium selenitireducens]
MKDQEEKFEKILVRYFSDVLGEEVVETLWAKIIDQKSGLYKIDNIPFYGPEFSSGDVVHAEFDASEDRLTFKKVIERSGNSTIQIIITGQNIEASKIREEFGLMGCENEGIQDNYFVMEVPFEVEYKEIFGKLSELESAGIISFAEPVISEKHNSEK